MPVRTEMYVDGRYLANNPTWDVEDSPLKAQFINNILARNNLAPESICEIGCGVGEILRQLSLMMPGVNYAGYEISPQAYELCKKLESERIKFHCSNFADDPTHFDCLLCIDVFEHVSDYIGFIESLIGKAEYKIFHIPLDISILSILRGRMMEQRRKVGHLHYFTKDTALATLSDSGYQIIDHFYTTWFERMPRESLEDKTAVFLRKRLYSISPDIMATWMGGCSLMVLAK
jgi:hypothetical protein